HVAVALLVLAARKHDAARCQVRHHRVLASRPGVTAVHGAGIAVVAVQRRAGRADASATCLDAVADVAVTARCIRGALRRQRRGRRGGGRGGGGQGGRGARKSRCRGGRGGGRRGRRRRTPWRLCERWVQVDGAGHRVAAGVIWAEGAAPPV